MIFSSCHGNLWNILELWWGRSFIDRVCSVTYNYCLVTKDTSGISSRLDRAIWTHVEVRRETKCNFLLATVIMGFFSIFKRVKDHHLLKH